MTQIVAPRFDISFTPPRNTPERVELHKELGRQIQALSPEELDGLIADSGLAPETIATAATGEVLMPETTGIIARCLGTSLQQLLKIAQTQLH